jgi:hypothetical protein
MLEVPSWLQFDYGIHFQIFSLLPRCTDKRETKLLIHVFDNSFFVFRVDSQVPGLVLE